MESGNKIKYDFPTLQEIKWLYLSKEPFVIMNFNELLNLNQTLLAENRLLKGKIKQLESLAENENGNYSDDKEALEILNESDNAGSHYQEGNTKRISKHSQPTQKIELFTSLFKGREDVFATRWDNIKKEIHLYVEMNGCQEFAKNRKSNVRPAITKIT